LKLSETNKIRFNIILIALIFGVVSWIVDAIVDYFFFFDVSFQNVLLFHLSPHMQFERIMIIVTFFISGIFISHLILQHRKVETHLQEIQERFKLVADFAKDWEYWITKDRKLNYVSPSAERITGYKPDEFMKDNTLLEKIVHPDDKEKFVNHTVQSLCETDLESFDFRIITKDNQIRWIEHSCQSVYDSKGMYLGHRASNKDITLNKTAEQKLAESEEALRKINEELGIKVLSRTKEVESLIEQSPFAIAIYDDRGRLIETNLKWNEIFKNGESKKGDIHLYDNEYLIAHGYLTQVKGLIRKGGRLKSEPILLEEEGKVYIFNIFDVKDEKGKVNRIICQLEDRTDELQREDINRELDLQKRISRAVIDILEQDRKRVAKELHDQIGQKLLLAKLGLEMIEEKAFENKEKIEEAKKQIIDISRDIKSIIFSLRPAELDNYGLTDAIQLMARKFSDVTGTKAMINVFGNVKVRDKKNELNVYRIIQEALNNISKHANASEVQIDLHFSSGMIRGSVKDNGVGFDVKDTDKGTILDIGYGLISMRERTKISGGEFLINSELGKGTEIYFAIPSKDIKDE